MTEKNNALRNLTAQQANMSGLFHSTAMMKQFRQKAFQMKKLPIVFTTYRVNIQILDTLLECIRPIFDGDMNHLQIRKAASKSSH